MSYDELYDQFKKQDDAFTEQLKSGEMMCEIEEKVDAIIREYVYNASDGDVCGVSIANAIMDMLREYHISKKEN